MKTLMMFGHKFVIIGIDYKQRLMDKVLVVDDDADLLEMVDMALSKQGFTTSTLNNGKYFFNTVESFRPDIILLDIFLGDADGRKLCHQLKEVATSQSIPVILYSAGHISGSSIEHSHANAFVSKPFDIKQLVEKIKVLLSLNR